MLLIYNGKVYCHDKFEEAVLIDKEIIQDVGKSLELLNKYPNAIKIDLEGKLVIPGFNDSHMHILSYAKSKKSLWLYDTKSINDVINQGKEYLHKNSGLIIGKGFNDELFIEKRVLTRYDLDLISKDVPIVCYRVCGHIASVNSKALEMCNISMDTKVDGGSLDIENNQLTGVIRENALELLEPLFSSPLNLNELKFMIKDALIDANKKGITSIGTNDINGNLEEGSQIYEAYKMLAIEKQLNVRINHQITIPNIHMLDEFLKNHLFTNSYLRVGALKLFIDGSLGAKTAYMSENYLNENHRGILCIDEDELLKIVQHADLIKLPVVIHAIGDQGIKVCLDAFSKVIKGNNELRHGIIHVQITDQTILNKFKELKVCAIVQPIFINSDMNIVHNRISSKLAKTSYAFKTLLDSTMTSFSSDSPVEDFNPLLGIYSSVTRANLDDNKFYNLEEKTTVKEAIDAYTINSAYMSFEEHNKGLIKKGYYGDLVVLNEDIFEIEPKYIKDVKVDMTIVGGKIVYKREE